MSEIVADPPDPSCYLLFSGCGIEQLQSVDPDPPFGLAVGRTAGFLRSSAGRVAETVARSELETNHGA